MVCISIYAMSLRLFNPLAHKITQRQVSVIAASTSLYSVHSTSMEGLLLLLQCVM